MASLLIIAATLTWVGSGYCLTRGEVAAAVVIGVPALILTALAVVI